MTRPGTMLAAVGLSFESDEDGLPPATVLSDLSANIFAALLIILILLLQLKVAADAHPEPAPAVDVGRALPTRPHTALRAGDIIALLRARGPDAVGTGFDLVEAGLRRPDGSGTIPSRDIAGALQAEAGSDPVRLYVFSNRWFAEATAALEQAGRSWSDLSVPRALRDRQDPQAWSPAFLRLVAGRPDETAFRDGLARLLAASAAPLVPDGRIAAGDGEPSGMAGRPGGGPPGGGPPDASPFAALVHTLALALAGLALAGGVALVVVLEVQVVDPALRS